MAQNPKPPKAGGKMKSLVLSRKVNEQVVIADGEIIVTLLEIRGDKVRLMFEAEANIKINRAEVQERINAESASLQ